MEYLSNAANGNVLATMVKSPSDGPRAESPSSVSSWWGDVNWGYTTVSAPTVGHSSCPSRFKGESIRSSCSDTERDCWLVFLLRELKGLLAPLPVKRVKETAGSSSCSERVKETAGSSPCSES